MLLLPAENTGRDHGPLPAELSPWYSGVLFDESLLKDREASLLPPPDNRMNALHARFPHPALSQ
jgi:hypothetical protein